jgi:hypothetical protein
VFVLLFFMLFLLCDAFLVLVDERLQVESHIRCVLSCSLNGFCSGAW